MARLRLVGGSANAIPAPARLAAVPKPRYALAPVTKPDAPHPTGRSPRWRLAMSAAGLLTLALGGALVAWPWLLAWVAAGLLGALGLLLLLSAVLARGG